jgi:hypothetical protein
MGISQARSEWRVRVGEKGSGLKGRAERLPSSSCCCSMDLILSCKANFLTSKERGAITYKEAVPLESST